MDLSIMVFFNCPNSRRPNPTRNVVLMTGDSNTLYKCDFINSRVSAARSPYIISFMMFSKVTKSLTTISAKTSDTSSWRFIKPPWKRYCAICGSCGLINGKRLCSTKNFTYGIKRGSNGLNTIQNTIQLVKNPQITAKNGTVKC